MLISRMLTRRGPVTIAAKVGVPASTVGRILTRTLATEWAYSRTWTSNTERAAALQTWLNYYNLERPHLGIGGQRPIDRVNNGPSQNS